MQATLQQTAAQTAAPAGRALPRPRTAQLARQQAAQSRPRAPQQLPRIVLASAAAGAAAPPRPSPSAADGGHTALLHSLGDVGDVAAVHMPWLLRLAHIRSRITGGDSAAALQESSRGLLLWKAALERGLVLDDLTIQQLVEEKDSRVAGQSVETLRWPEEPLRAVLVRGLSTLGVARFAQRYPALLDALLRSVLELVCKYHKTVIGEVEVDERERDASGQVYMTAAELMAEEVRRRGELARSANKPTAAQQAAAAAVSPQQVAEEEE